MTTPGHEPAHANQVSRWIAQVEIILAGLSGVAMAAIMVIVTIDVVLRYAFAAPLSWSYEMIGLYLAGQMARRAQTFLRLGLSSWAILGSYAGGLTLLWYIRP